MAATANSYYNSKKSGVDFEKYYKDTLDNAASYNSRICVDRRMRLPFLDSQTGLAQNHSNLWVPARYRQPGQTAGQLYTYPARRWKKKKREIPLVEVQVTKAADVETGELDAHKITTVENPVVSLAEEIKTEMYVESPKVEYYDEWESISDPPDAGEIEDQNTDASDYEETYVKKKKKKSKKSGGRGRKSGKQEKTELDDSEKPYSCNLCGARYKTRPGLSYHLTHFHRNTEQEQPSETAPSPKPANQSQNGKSANGKANPNKYCDFCLGDETENKKTGQREDLVSCADCGRSGHPSCLQFTPNMIISVKKYPWQCIECKSCGLCGTSDNDDQLLFCDDCDRGYHMYCLNPPLSEPPEGSWSCHLCIEEFYGGVKPEGQL